MVRETRLSPADMIAPLFVRHGSGLREPIPSMPGQYHLSVDELVSECAGLHALGVPAVILFGLPAYKDEAAAEAYADEGIVQLGLRAVREAVPEMILITDVCLCQYMSHGHCGVLLDGQVDNDVTLELLAQVAVSHALAGADVVAPSDMMDGRVGAIRGALDGEGLSGTAILAYSAKFASAFYGPFRDAAHSAPQEGDRRGYQMDPANGREAIREMALDVAEGADILLVKPALPGLDLIAAARARFDVPIAAYQVSGEFAMIAAAAERGWLDGRRAMTEAVTAIVRAGAGIVLTYAAADLATWLLEESRA